jgi:NADPH2:quinone reductase
MRAIRLHEFGPAANLVYEEVDDPEPGPGQVRIAVAAAGVHFIDTAIRAGRRMGPMPLPDLPQIPGREVAGTVEALGPDVGDEWFGRRVVVHLGPASGGYAALAVREVEAVHALDDRLSDAAAAAMIGTGRTTMAILDVAALQPDDVALVTAAASGVGSLLVQAGDLFRRGLTASAALGGVADQRALEQRALAAATGGDLAPLVTSFPLAQAADAHAAIESRATIGKVVLVP